ncbi:uncharacterized protein LOC144885996 [Branchiostoma floridae x Branchiostoma japonicum]
MPKGRKAAGKDKGKQPRRPYTRRKKVLKTSEELDAETSGSELSEPGGGRGESNVDGSSDEPLSSSQQPSQKASITEDQDEKIASFIESHPAFYDMSTPEYKNKQKKDAWLKDVAPEIGLTPKQILTRFQTMRTDYFKLKRKLAGKSGQGQTRVTPLQDFKLRRYKFLDAHYRGRASSTELGSVKQPVFSVDEEEEEESSDGPRHDVSKASILPKNKKSKKGLGDVLVELLADSQKELKQSQATLAESSSSASSSTRGGSERDAFAQWLARVQHDIPDDRWRSYQREVFDVALRYSTGTQPPQTRQHEPLDPPASP